MLIETALHVGGDAGVQTARGRAKNVDKPRVFHGFSNDMIGFLTGIFRQFHV
jgi:hypothetical protein